MLTALRQKNMNLYEKVQMCETWKMRALLKIASNEFEMRTNVKGHSKAKDGNMLYLDGLQYTVKELKELNKVIANYMKQDSVKEITLQDNALDRSAVPHLCELLDLCPYVTKLDLRRNKLDSYAIGDLQAFIERIPGVTSLLRDPAKGDLRAKSGNQLRLLVCLEDQSPPDDTDKSFDPATGGDDLFAVDPSGQAADQFLASIAGVTSQTKLAGPYAAGGGANKSLLAPQRPGGAGVGTGGGAPGGLDRSLTASSRNLLPKINNDGRR